MENVIFPIYFTKEAHVNVFGIHRGTETQTVTIIKFHGRNELVLYSYASFHVVKF